MVKIHRIFDRYSYLLDSLLVLIIFFPTFLVFQLLFSLMHSANIKRNEIFNIGLH